MSKNRIDCVVFDFDGTLTDADAHAKAFFAESRACLADVLQLDVEQVEKIWALAESYVLGAAPEFGWENGGLVVAPGHCDPYLVGNSTTARILSANDPSLKGDALGEKVFQIHARAYDRIPPSFRTDAAETLQRACDRARVFVVTNSSTARVRARLERHVPQLMDRIHVCGDARKFVVEPGACQDARFLALPTFRRLDGLDRKVWLRRGHYYDVLAAIWNEVQSSPEQTLVCGDNFELDLAMPLALGCHGHLVLRESTLPHEVSAGQRSDHCNSSRELGRALSVLEA